MNIFTRFSLVATVTLMTAFMLAAAIAVVALFTYSSISKELQNKAIESQHTSLRLAATMMARDIPDTTIILDKDSNVDKIVMSAVPTEFPSDNLIDFIGRMTGQSVTIFGMDATTKNFLRRTTTIMKADGTRAVGTELDHKSAAFATINQGNTYRGEAVILDVSYYTTYQPIISQNGSVVGILYVGVRSSDIDSIANRVAYVITITAVTVLLACIIAITLATRKIMGPIPLLTKVASEVAKGNLDIVVPSQLLGNEIGALARTLDVLRLEALQKQALEAEALDARNKAEHERQRNAEIGRNKAEDMANATSSLGQGLNHLANGNLCCKLEEPLAAEFEGLRANFNSAISKLADTLRAVIDASGTIDTGSREINGSVNDLSKRTEQQATALEETAAALDKITANVANSSNLTGDARMIAADANASAVQSGKVVAEAVNAMVKIEQSSSQITNIIVVIDEIAFQTNLLALNAGVEAARAGEAGKGFAVVAQEVRELAQRSAKAAKEIKELIRKSTTEVETGVRLVSETGQSLSKIENYIVTFNQHMVAIEKSAREQSNGLAEVNTAVNQMDQVTQRNAAMVEETSAASSALEAESNRLRELVDQFELGDASHRTATGVVTNIKYLHPEGAPVRA